MAHDITAQRFLPHEMTRRHWVQAAVFGALGIKGLFAQRPQGQAEKNQPLNRYPRMVQEWFVEQARLAESQKINIINRLSSKADAEAYIKSVKGKIRQCFGPEPERTPLNAWTTGIVERDTYTIEKIIFESRPHFPVTANLYLPKDIKTPRPGVVGSCGHSDNGKAAEAYQSFAQGLVRLGYACLIYDPIGQGERLQYVKEDLSPKIGVGVAEHLHAGNQQFLVGEFLGMWRAWDGIRALDYLLSRKEVDPKHVGITGNSGGGTMTTWLCGVESRWTMAAPACFVTTFRRNLENELPADTEQCPPLALALSLDHDDFLAAMAPKPVIILGKEKDFFDVRGTEEAYGRLKKLYALLGAEDNIALAIGPTYHGYSQENREAMYRWFNKVTEISDAQTEPALQIEKDETLQCSPKGQVAEMEAVRNVFHFTRDKANELKKARGQVQGNSLLSNIREVLKLPRAPESAADYRITRPLGNRGYPTRYAATYAVETERGIQAIVYRLSSEQLLSRPPKAGTKAILYVSHLSSDQELREEPFLKELIEANPDVPFFTCDVRGSGESQPDTCGPNSFHSAYGSDYFYAIHSLMLDRPYLGQKTFDVLRVLEWLASVGHTEIHLAGMCRGALAATFAGLLSEHVKQVTLKHALTSYDEIAHSEDYDWPLSTLLPNVLAKFDLPDCYEALKSKQLRIIEPWSAKVTEQKV